MSPRVLSVTAGDSVTLEFSVAVDSNGLTWSRDRVNFTFNSTRGEESVVSFTAADENFPHNFIYVIEKADRSHAGEYTAMASSMIVRLAIRFFPQYYKMAMSLLVFVVIMYLHAYHCYSTNLFK